MSRRLPSILSCCLALLLAACGAEEQSGRVSVAPGARPLAKALEEKAAAFTETAPAELKQLFARASKELAESGILARAMNMGGRMPSISFEDAGGEAVTLGALLEKGPVVLAFYRGKW
jgi:hypothetical protein